MSDSGEEETLPIAVAVEEEASSDDSEDDEVAIAAVVDDADEDDASMDMDNADVDADADAESLPATPSKNDEKKKRKRKQSSPKKQKSGETPSIKDLGIPFRAIKRIMKIDKDIGTVQNEAAMIATYAVELFVEKMVLESNENARKRGRNTVK